MINIIRLQNISKLNINKKFEFEYLTFVSELINPVYVIYVKQDNN